MLEDVRYTLPFWLGAPPNTWPWWLIGTYLSMAAELVCTFGLVLLKQSHNKYGSWKCSSAGLWLGGFSMIAAPGLRLAALICAPCSTVTAAASTQVFFCYVLSRGILGERYNRRDTIAFVVMLVGGLLALFIVTQSETVQIDMSSWFPPPKQVKGWVAGLEQNWAFLTYAGSYSLMLMIVLRLHWFKYAPFGSLVRRPWHSVTLPILAGQLAGGCRLFANFVASLLYNYEKADVWNSPIPWIIAGCALALLLLQFFFTLQGIKELDLRFFLPTSLATAQILTVIQGIIFFREWQSMSAQELIAFGISSFASCIAASEIEPRHDTMMTPAWGPQHQEVFGLTDDPLASPRGVNQVVGILAEHGVGRALEASHPAPRIVDMSKEEPVKGCWAVIIRVFPALMVFGTPGSFCLLAYFGYSRTAFAFFAVYFMYAAWRFAIHISVFTNVGKAKCDIYGKTDWQVLHEQVHKGAAKQSWAAVRHYVVLPNYKEEFEILCEAIDTIAVSAVAKTQICLVLAMEAREEESHAKADRLEAKYRDRFMDVIATFHPPGLPGEVPGKAANTRWAAQELFRRHPEGTRDGCIVTVADADSCFHEKYFSALTFHYLSSGNQSNATIWQPPILHYKNYHTQPAVVRMASMLTSQHEVARLADPTASRLPYSTYSLSLEVAASVGGWDPDWISEDWHMYAKCYLACGGRLKIQPIFLPVINYAPEGEHWFETIMARWTQAKRHALGVSELVYVMSMYPALKKHHTGDPGFLWRVSHVWMHMLSIHLYLGTLVISGPINTVLAGIIMRDQLLAEGITFPVAFAGNLAAGFVMSASLVFWCITNVYLYRSVKNRITPLPAGSSTQWFDVTILHFGRVTVESFLWSPIFFVMGACAEWIAATKTMFTHQFQYDVALKAPVPKAAADEETPLLAGGAEAEP
eukprot:Hpha_TRINITY_DN14163_c0_g1::TRINITY_DN14163_c0_g1_i1::g.10477::m.10477